MKKASSDNRMMGFDLISSHRIIPQRNRQTEVVPSFETAAAFYFKRLCSICAFKSHVQQHENLISLDLKILRCCQIYDWDISIGFPKAVGQMLPNAAERLKVSQTGSLHGSNVSSRDAIDTYMNYRDDNGNYQIQSVPVLSHNARNANDNKDFSEGTSIFRRRRCMLHSLTQRSSACCGVRTHPALQETNWCSQSSRLVASVSDLVRSNSWVRTRRRPRT